MGERLSLQPVSGLKTLSVEVCDHESVGMGIEHKEVLGCNIGERSISLFERYDEVDRYIENWFAFRNVGLPVVPTIRRTDRGSLVGTDVKADGSEVYGKGLLGSIVFPGVVRNRAHRAIDYKFLQILNSSEVNEIRNRAMEHTHIATENNLLLPFDDAYELIVNPTGSWKIMILDLKKAGIITLNSGDFVSSNLRRINNFFTEIFLFNLQTILKIMQTGNRINSFSGVFEGLFGY